MELYETTEVICSRTKNDPFCELITVLLSRVFVVLLVFAVVEVAVVTWCGDVVVVGEYLGQVSL